MKTQKLEKPRLTFWQIWNMSFGFLGIQFGFGLQNANVSRIFQTLGANMDEIPILWVAAPVTGLIVQPIIGYLSDRTWSPRFGRRRPYFLIGAILASIGLVLMPNSPTLWIAAGMLWIMDASINISMEPFRAFVGDNLPDSQRTTGFAMQSFFIGLGAVVASYLPWVLHNWFSVPNTAPPNEIAPNVHLAFYIGAAVFFIAVLWTVTHSKEYPPDELASFSDQEEEQDQEESFSKKEQYKNGRGQLIVGIILLVIGLAFAFWLTIVNIERQLYIIAGLIALAGLLAILAGALQLRGRMKNPVVTMVNDFQHMPKTMLQLTVVQFFTWFALYSMWIYTTPGVTSHLFGTRDTTSEIYNDAADMVGNWFGVYSAVCFGVAFLIPVLSRLTNRRITHLICLTLGGLGLISIFFLKNPMWGYASMVGVGIAWASILSIPYAILSGSLPSGKMGFYMGIFNFFIVIPQILAAAILGLIIKRVFNDEPIYALIIGGCSLIVAGLFSLMVDDKKDIKVRDTQ